MKSPYFRACLLACSVILSSAARSAGTEECPLDRITFVDNISGRAFVSSRVAVRYIYSCETGWTEKLNRPLTDDADCRGPFGDTIIEGSLDGRKAFAVYTVSDQLPCCVWYSYSASTVPRDLRNARWLAHEDVPHIDLEDGWYMIGPPNPPFDPDEGPMGGGEFVPKVCRTG